jgi:hypothetical protein
MAIVLHNLDNFKWEKLPNSCENCDRDPTGAVRRIQAKVRNVFDGLCLDCMDKHKSKTGDQHSDYWLHNKLDEWDTGCHITHGQSTWYYSFMGQTRIDTKKRVYTDNHDMRRRCRLN